MGRGERGDGLEEWGGEGLWGERGCERWEGGGIGVWVFGVGW